jgi:hypothetical protein
MLWVFGSSGPEVARVRWAVQYQFYFVYCICNVPCGTRNVVRDSGLRVLTVTVICHTNLNCGGRVCVTCVFPFTVLAHAKCQLLYDCTVHG